MIKYSEESQLLHKIAKTPAPRWAPTVVVLSLTVEWGVGMERQGPSYGEVVSTRDVRVQALLGGSNSPTSWSPEAVDWFPCIRVTGVRTLYTEEGGGLYRVRQTPPALSYVGFKVH